MYKVHPFDIVANSPMSMGEERWMDPRPLGQPSPQQSFPTDALPTVGREIVEDVSEVCQVDPGFVASNYLGILSSQTCGRVEVDLTTHREPATLYLVQVYDSGNRKTSVAKILAAPLHIRKVASRICVLDDATPEALSQVMAEHNERASIISAEGGLLEKIASGRYSDNIDILLKGHAGDFWRCNRIGRQDLTMYSPSLTICLSVQLDVLRKLGKNEDLHERGLMARILYSVHPSRIGYRERQTRPISEHILIRHQDSITGLDGIPPGTNLTLTGDAQAVWDNAYNYHEKAMRPGGEMEHIGKWGSKLPGAIARIAALLHFGERGSRGYVEPISANTMTAAEKIGGYFKDHSLAVYSYWEEQPYIEIAKLILEYLRLHKQKNITLNDIFSNKAFKNASHTIHGMNVLMNHRYIWPTNNVHADVVNTADLVYAINPKIYI